MYGQPGHYKRLQIIILPYSGDSTIRWGPGQCPIWHKTAFLLSSEKIIQSCRRACQQDYLYIQKPSDSFVQQGFPLFAKVRLVHPPCHMVRLYYQSTIACGQLQTFAFAFMSVLIVTTKKDPSGSQTKGRSSS